MFEFIYTKILLICVKVVNDLNNTAYLQRLLFRLKRINCSGT